MRTAEPVNAITRDKTKTMTITVRCIFTILFFGLNMLGLGQGLRIAIINDVHLNMTDSDIPNDLGSYG